MSKYTYEEFRDLCKEKGYLQSWQGGDLHEVSWSLGGTHCNCWGDTYEADPEPEPEDTILEEVLDTFVPNMTLREYRNLKLVGVYDTNTHEEYDYYGGSVTTCTRTLDFKALYEQIKHLL